MNLADEIWNRALDMDGADRAARVGDRALRDTLLLHGMAMNGGLLHAVEGLEPEELDGAVSGLRWLGLEDLADAVTAYAADAADAEGMSDDEVGALEDRGNDLYYDAVPEDELLYAAFHRRFTAQPEAFAPLG